MASGVCGGNKMRKERRRHNKLATRGSLIFARDCFLCLSHAAWGARVCGENRWRECVYVREKSKKLTE